MERVNRAGLSLCVQIHTCWKCFSKCKSIRYTCQTPPLSRWKPIIFPFLSCPFLPCAPHRLGHLQTCSCTCWKCFSKCKSRWYTCLTPPFDYITVETIIFPPLFCPFLPCAPHRLGHLQTCSCTHGVHLCIICVVCVEDVVALFLLAIVLWFNATSVI